MKNHADPGADVRKLLAQVTAALVPLVALCAVVDVIVAATRAADRSA